MIVYTCINCENYEMGRTCKAFKNKIPSIIWEGENPHKKPLKDQKNTIVFEPIKAK